MTKETEIVLLEFLVLALTFVAIVGLVATSY
jgi:hypothetical protein